MQPERPDVSIQGVLHLEPKRGWVLALSGTFEKVTPSNPTVDPPVVSAVTASNDYPILLGMTAEGRGMTAFGCQILSAVSPGKLKLLPKILVHDVHFEGVEDFKLFSLSVRFSNLDAWADTSGFEIKSGPEPYPVDIRYSKPESLLCEIEKGLTIGVSFAVAGPDSRPSSELKIVQRAWLRVTTAEARSYEELAQMVTRLSDLVALAIGQPVRPLEFSGRCDVRVRKDGGIVRQPAEIIDNRKPIAPELSDVDSTEMLFTASSISGRFGETVRAWFQKHDAVGPLYQLYFGTLRSPWMYVEHRFINMFQALESHHRRIPVQPADDLDQKEARVQRILGLVTETEDRKWLERRLRRRYEPAAAHRIREIVESVNAAWLLDGKNIDLAADLRNFITHFDLKLEGRLPPKADRSRLMHDLGVRLRVLCEMLLLRELGFTNDWIRQRILETGRVWRWPE